MERLIYKTPAELDFYTIVYSELLDTDIISSSTWAATDRTMTVNSPASSFTGLTTKVWIGGGTINNNTAAYVSNSVVTTQRQIDRSIRVIVRQYNILPLIIAKQTNIDILDYGIDWTDQLLSGADSIVSSSWQSSDTTLHVAGQPSYIQGSKAIVWLSGGVAGRKYLVTNTIGTALGRTLQGTFTVNVNQTILS